MCSMAMILRLTPCSITLQRFSVFIPFILYLLLLALHVHFSIPLRSEQKHSMKSQNKVDNEKSTLLRTNKVNDYENSRRQEQDLKDLPPTELLASVFKKVDRNDDALLSIQELSEYIHMQTQNHINQGMQENYGLFMSIDRDPPNGVISWAEYHKYFLLKNGIPEDYVDNHHEKHEELQRSVKELIARDKASWSEAARSDPDSLTLDEFLAFRHPESSHVTILTLVDELLDKLGLSKIC